ncbi:MAG TPA: F0F1 ATP synthase subunit B [Clostridiaceae bacterium]
MKIELSVVIASMINFGIFFLIFRFRFYKPINNVISKRQSEIIDRLKDTEENQKKAEVLRLENEAHVKNAKENGKLILEEYKHNAEKMSADIISQTKNEAQLLLERAKMDINREKEKAKDELRKEAVDLAVMLSIKALEGTIDEENHRKLIKDFLVKVGV